MQHPLIPAKAGIQPGSPLSRGRTEKYAFASAKTPSPPSSVAAALRSRVPMGAIDVTRYLNSGGRHGRLTVLALGLSLGLRLCRHSRRGPVLGATLVFKPGLGSFLGIQTLCRLRVAGHETGAHGFGIYRVSRFSLLGPGRKLDHGAWRVVETCSLSIGRLFSMGRLGRCRKLFFLRRSLERGVILVAVTGTGR